MRCRYTFTVTSDAALPTSIRFKDGLTEFTLHEEKHRFVAVIVEQSGVKFTQPGSIAPPTPGKPMAIVIPTDPLLPFIQMELRAIRGALALWGVYDVNVNHPKVDWLPESDAEKAATPITGFKRADEPLGSRKPLPYPVDQLIRPFVSRRRYLSIEIPLEYFRRGQEDLAKAYYIEAIYDFYFVLEFLFADGKFSKHTVRDAMLASDEFKRIVVESQVVLLPDLTDDPVALARFKATYERESVENVIDKITDLRGLLHHQSQTRKNNWNPSTPEPFKADAYFLAAMAHSAVLNLSTQLEFLPDEEAKFKATVLTTTDGKKIGFQPAPEPPFMPGVSVPPSMPPKP